MKIDSFVRMYHGRGIEDWGAGVSDEFNEFAKDFRSMIRSAARSVDADLVRFWKGHYYVDGFFKRGSSYAYFAYSVPRGGFPINCKSNDALFGILVRSAASDSDFKGGFNMFCDFFDFRKTLDSCLN